MTTSSNARSAALTAFRVSAGQRLARGFLTSVLATAYVKLLMSLLFATWCLAAHSTTRAKLKHFFYIFASAGEVNGGTRAVFSRFNLVKSRASYVKAHFALLFPARVAFTRTLSCIC
jgi:bacteriorhodopsin